MKEAYKILQTQIFKVSFPNFLDDGIWSFSISFINSILLMTMGAIGPILYSVALKLRTLVTAPVRSYGRGLMSVTGHLFGAEKFDDLEKMFKYVMKISIFTTLVVMIAFIFLREYVFSIFSVTGMENEIFWIAIGGTFLMVLTPVSMISAKMLDGFGKSMYSLMFTIIRIIFEVALIVLLANIVSNGACVLIGICCGQLLSSIIYYLFLRHLFNNFGKEYKFKYTVKTFNIKRKKKIDKFRQENQRRKDEFRENMKQSKQDRIERRDKIVEKLKKK